MCSRCVKILITKSSFQSCTDKRSHTSVEYVDSNLFNGDAKIDISNTSSRKVPIESDFLFSYSTVPGT